MTRLRQGVTRPPRAAAWALFDALVQDVVFALRLFRRRASILAATVVGLAVATAFATIVFMVVNAALLRPLGVHDPDSLYWVMERGPVVTNSAWRYADYLRLRQLARRSRLAAKITALASLGSTTDTTGLPSVPVVFVSAGFFEVMGGTAAVGRTLAEEDHAAEASRAAVVNYDFWRDRFGADDAIVGDTVTLSGVAFRIIGVAEPSFRGPSPEPPAFWLPLESYGLAWGPVEAPFGNQEFRVGVYARPLGGASKEEAGAELDALAASLANERSDSDALLGVQLNPADMRFQGSGAAIAWTVTSVVVVVITVLLLACANLTSALLASAIARRREIGIRLALGASRARIIRQLLTESIMISALAGGLGLAVAWWAMSALRAALPLMGLGWTLDPRVYAFVVAVSLVIGLVAGLEPARLGARGDITSSMSGSDGSLATTRRARRSRSMLVGMQAMAAALILVMAGLLTAAAVRVTRYDYGLDVDRMVTVSPSFRAAGYDPARAATYWDDAVRRVSRLPGVEYVALVENLPFGSTYRAGALQIEGRSETVEINFTTADWFATAGLRVVRGRSFTDEEVAAGEPVAVVSEGVARQVWGSVDRALGGSLEPVAEGLLGRFGVGDFGEELRRDLVASRVVGVVADATTNLTRGELATRIVYLPLEREMARNTKLVARVGGSAAAFLPTLREAIDGIDPGLRVSVSTLEEGLERGLDATRFLAALAHTTGLVSFALAIAGVAGLAAFIVERRVPEIGLRMAVGASPGEVVALMVRDSLRPVLLGGLAGVALAIYFGPVMDGVLYGVSAYDPVPVLSALAVLVVTALLAGFIPARRAAHIDPVAALQRR